jgi:hypothetical protein
MALQENVAPTVAFMRISVYYHKDVKPVLGDCIEAYEGMDNTSRSHSAACAALYLANNVAGLWQLHKIQTQSREIVKCSETFH